MNHPIIETLQESAHRGAGWAIATTTATAPWWVAMIETDEFKAIAAIFGLLVAATVVIANIATVVQKTRQSKYEEEIAKLRALALRDQLKERGIDPN